MKNLIKRRKRKVSNQRESKNIGGPFSIYKKLYQLISSDEFGINIIFYA